MTLKPFFTPLHAVAATNVWRCRLLGLLAAATLLGSGSPAHAQQPAPGSLDPGFEADFTGGYGAVSNLAVQPDGKVILVGAFNLVNGAARKGLARVNADGSLDAGFNVGMGADGFYLGDGSVTVQPDGKILLDGTYIEANGFARHRVVRLNADGSLDAGFNAATNAGANDRASVLALQADGKIIVNGGFSQVSGTPRKGFARLNADGSLDAGFAPQIPNSDFPVYAAAVQPDGKIVIAGNFSEVSGVTRLSLARLNPDGSLDASFDAGRAASYSSATTVVLQADGKVLLGGSFSQEFGQTSNGIIRLNADGSLDQSFKADTGSTYGATESSHGTVSNLVVQPDGKIILSGAFTKVNGVSRTGFARLNIDGSLDAGFNADIDGRSGEAKVALQADGKLILGGGSILVNGILHNNVARLQGDGSLDAAFNVISGQSDGGVSTVTVQPDGKVLLGGDFIQINGVPYQGLARLNADGSLDAGFSPAPGTGGFYALQPDGKILTGSLKGIARLNADGSLNAGFNADTSGGFGSVSHVAVQPDGKILVGRYFSLVNHLIENGLIRFNADGSPDTTFHDGSRDLHPFGVSLSISPLTVQPDGKILLVSSYNFGTGPSFNPPDRLNADGTVDASFHSEGNLLSANASALAVQPDGKIIVGLESHKFYAPPGGVVRLNEDGSRDQSFNNAVANAAVYCLTVQPDGKIIVGGVFSQINGTTRNGIARLNADGSLDVGFDASTNNNVSAVAVQPDGKILLGGGFTRVNGVARNGVARLNGDFIVPVLTGASSASAQVGQPFAYQIAAANRPASFGAVGLPEGLNVNPITGQISGTPTQAGTFVVTLSATNVSGKGTATLTLNIAPAPLPVISVSVDAPAISRGAGQVASVTFARPENGDRSRPLVIAYTVSGSLLGGNDYVTLSGTKKIKAGRASAYLRVIPVAGGANGNVKLKVSPGEGYTVGAVSRVKVKVAD